MTDVRGPLETVYDAEIAPLVEQIITVCKAHDLPIFATFQLDADLVVTTFVAPALQDWPEASQEEYKYWRDAMEMALRFLPSVATVAVVEIMQGTSANGLPTFGRFRGLPQDEN